MASGVLQPGDSRAVHGSYSVFLYAPTGPATLKNSHFADIPDSYATVINLDTVTPSVGIMIELAGTVVFESEDPEARCSLVAINIGGTR